MESLGISLFISILLISRIHNVSTRTYHNTGEYQLPAEHIRGLASITFCQIMEKLRHKTGNSLAMFVLCISLLSCIHYISNKFYHGTGEDQLYTKHRRSTCECCLGEYCVSSYSRYGLKQGIPCNLFVYIYSIEIMSY